MLCRTEILWINDVTTFLHVVLEAAAAPGVCGRSRCFCEGKVSRSFSVVEIRKRKMHRSERTNTEAEEQDSLGWSGLTHGNLRWFESPPVHHAGAVSGQSGRRIYRMMTIIRHSYALLVFADN